MNLYMFDPEINLVSIYPVTADIPWTDLDMGGHVPSNALFVLLRQRMQGNRTELVADWKLWIRPKGGSQTIEVLKARSLVDPTFVAVNDSTIEIGTDRKIEYKLDMPPGAVNCSVVINLLGYIYTAVGY